MPRQWNASRPSMGLLAGLVMFAVLVFLASVLQEDDSARERLPTATAPPADGVRPPRVAALPGTDAVERGQRPQELLEGWADSMSEELNIPLTALEAYGYAELALERSRPECRLSWSVLAGIGAVESGHGRYGGADLDRTGRPDPPIRGVVLDGSEGIRLVRDTDGGELDGDSTYDRAVGPLQFIPSTWRTWGRDADADGEADPDDMDDAALAAAHYLCSADTDLREPEQFRDAVLRYNASGDYVQQVLNHADDYGKRSRDLVRRE